ncbi:hypothetical protein COU36_02450, partial [Candidatus Micrarchaeota archaeon CG10_big_fil_rev_8_21_14_0_10_59_7]
LDKAMVSINTTPAQFVVARNGSYSLEAPAGEYEVTASYKYGNATYSDSDYVKIASSGSFSLDLVIFSFEQVFDEGDGIPENPVPEEGGEIAFLYVAAGLLAGVAIAYAIWTAVKGRGTGKGAGGGTGSNNGNGESWKGKAETKTATAIIPKKPQSAGKKAAPQPILPPLFSPNTEQKEILAFLRKEGGRATQKEIRKALPYSEAKISTDLAILEDAGVVRKIKKGRGNIVRLS